MQYTYLKKIPAVVISVDFKKAFDRVEYQSLYKIMEWYNFGPIFIGYIKMLFTNFCLVTVNNGHTSPPFSPTRGLFQGNPIASYAFLLIMELLATMLRVNKNIEELNVKETRPLLAQFADDLTLFLKFQQKSWNEVVLTFELFEGKTGMKINYNKSTVYRIGSLER